MMEKRKDKKTKRQKDTTGKTIFSSLLNLKLGFHFDEKITQIIKLKFFNFETKVY